MDADGFCPVILHVDLDCFYAAVEQVRLNIPQEQPVAVQQWEGLIAVNYAARSAGVVRHDRVSEALKKCPDLHLVHVETVGSDQGIIAAARRDMTKVSLERYREASKCVFEIFHQYADVCERASIDEAYLDVTRKVDTLIEKGCDWDFELQRLAGSQLMADNVKTIKEKVSMIIENDSIETCNNVHRRLLAGAIFADQLRGAVRSKLGYTCSVGIATNKLLAKIASARHKPDQQTLISPRSVPALMNSLPLKKVKLLGGKIGEEFAEKFGCKTAGDAQQVPLKHLLALFGDRLGHYVFKAVRGVHEDKVQEKQMPKSMLAAKSFQATHDISTIKKWLGVLADELSIRMLRDAQENHRHPHSLHLYYRSGSIGQNGDHSKSCAMPHAVFHLLSSQKELHSGHCGGHEVCGEELEWSFPDTNDDDGIGRDFKVVSDVRASNKEVQVFKSEKKFNVVSTPAKDLAKLLQDACFQLFQRIAGAFPCTRLAISASGFQDAPMQGSQSIQNFFRHALKGAKMASSNISAAVQSSAGSAFQQHQPKGILRYVNNDGPFTQQDEDTCRKQSKQRGNFVLGMGAENLTVPFRKEDDKHRCLIDESKSLRYFTNLEDDELRHHEPSCGQERSSTLHACPGSASRSGLDDFGLGDNNLCIGTANCQDHSSTFGHSVSSCQEESPFTMQVGHHAADEFSLQHVNVDEQHRILEEIHSSRKGKGSDNVSLDKEAGVVKRRKAANGQASISKYFGRSGGASASL